MKKIIAALAATAFLGLGGCGASTFGSGYANFVSGLQTNVIDPTAKFFSDPNTQLVFSRVAKATQVASCAVERGTALAGKIEADAHAGVSIQGTNDKFNASSSDVCNGLGAVFSGTTTVPAGTSVVTGAAVVQ